MGANYTYVHDHKDHAHIKASLREYVTKLSDGARAKGWAAGAVDRLMRYAEDAADGRGMFDAVVLADTHILLFQTMEVWWLDGETLVEFSFFRYKDGGNTKDMHAAIEQLAKDRGCNQVVISSSAAVSDRGFQRLLTSHGFVQGSIQFVKEINVYPAPVLRLPY